MHKMKTKSYPSYESWFSHIILSNMDQNEKSFISFDAVTLTDAGRSVFKDLSWEMKTSETWAIVGATGAGKTSFLKALTGEYFLKKGNIFYNFEGSEAPITDFLDLEEHLIAFVPFKEASRAFDYSRHYYQQRYNATEAEDSITIEDFLRPEIHVDYTPEQKSILELLSLETLRPLQFIKLSTGETRRVRLAKALLSSPQLLLLDNPFVGLDKAMCQTFSVYIDKLVAAGIKIIITGNYDELPSSVTHILEIENAGIKQNTTKEKFLTSFHTMNEIEKNVLNFQRKKRQFGFKTVVEMKNVRLNYGEKEILKDFSWTVRGGEKWALLGANGSGKSTLLSLIFGDNPKAYSNPIKLFDRRRGSGESIWDIKKKIGFISPEIQFYFEQGLTCEAVAASGFFDTMQSGRALSKREQNNLDALFDFFGLTTLLDQDFEYISDGQQRVVLLIRALVKDPPLLILDEPFQNMDAFYLQRSMQLLEQYCNADKTLIIVTHYTAEIPKFVDNIMQL